MLVNHMHIQKGPLCLLIFSSIEQKHIAIGLFHAKDINGVVLFVKLKQVLDKFLFTQNILICVIGRVQFANLCNNFQFDCVM